jgi:phospholipase/lecithinase/hemolysin
VVSFGDSLSDLGTYTPATSVTGDGKPPYIGGKFTTNTDTATIWIQNVATTLGVLVTPAEVGFAGVSAKCPAAANPALADTCTGYGQGGARVTNPDGVGHSGGALTVPVVTQIQNHLARFGSFKSTDLVVVFAGSNDVFAQFEAFTIRAAQIQDQAQKGQLTADQANQALFKAQSDAQAGMQTAALQLADYVKTQILAKGGKYVAVLELIDIADTPFGNSDPVALSGLKPVLTTLSQTFNLWLRDALTGQPVQLVDTYSLFKDIYANPATYGIVNNTVPACDAAKISAITGGAMATGSSLFCNATPGSPLNGLRVGASDTTWFFADSVHPTIGGHKVFSDVFTSQLKAFGWI